MDVANLDVRVDSKSVKTASANLTGMGAASSGAMSKIKLLSGALVAMGAGRVLAKVISDTNQFTKSISELSAITGATGKDLAFYEEQAALIGKTTTLSASQAATAFKLIASAKPDLLASKEALAAVTKEAVTLAEAAGVGLADAAQTVGVSLNQFGAEADQAARFVNVLAAGAKMGSSSITDTSAAMKNAGVAAKLAGLSFEEANVGVQLLAKGGLFAAEAGTGFRQVLLKLENEAENKFKPSMVGLAGALENLSKENMTLTELTELFGAEAMKSAAVMIDGAGDARALEAAITGTSIASEMAATNFDNMEGDVLSLNSANEGLAITLGKMLEPAIRKSIQAATDFSRALDDFVKSDKFILLINAATRVLQVFSIIIGVKLIAALGASVIAFSSASTAAMLFGKAVTLAGGPISVGIIALWSFWEILSKIGNFKSDNFSKELQAAAIGGVQPLTEHIEQLRLEQDRLTISTQNGFEGTTKYRREFAELQITTQALTEAEKVLAEKVANTTDSTVLSTTAADGLAAQLLELTSNLQDTVSPEMAAHSEIVENQTDKYKELTFELGQQMTQVTMNAKEQFLYNSQLKLGSDATMEEKLSVETLAGALFDAEEEQKAFIVNQNEMTKSTLELNDSYRNLTESLNVQMMQVTMNEREQLLYNNQLKLGANATMEERLAIEDLTGTLFDAEAEQKAFVTAQEEITKSTTKLTDAQEFQKNMIENVQQSFGDLIYKTLDDGKINFKSFFTTVLDGFKRMVAELAAQKIMEAIFGGGGIDGFLSKLSGGFGGIMNTIKGGLSGIVGTFSSSISGLVSKGLSLLSSGAAAVTGVSSAAAASSAAAGVSGIAAGMAAASSAAAGSAAGVSGIAAGMAANGAAVTGAAAGGTGIAATLSTVGSTIAGAASAVGGAIAAGASAVGGAIAAGGAKVLALATGPIGLAVLATAAIAKLLDDSGTMSSNVGMITDSSIDLGDRGFKTEAFASGAEFTGFVRRGTESDANDVIDTFRSLDAALTSAAGSVGLTPTLSASDFIGSDEKGGGVGAFIGTASEDGKTKSQSISSQLDTYAARFVQLTGQQKGIDQATIDSIIGDGTASGILARTSAASQATADAAAATAAATVAAATAAAEAATAAAIATTAAAAETANYASLSSFGTVAGIRSKEEIEAIAKGIDIGAFTVDQVADQFNVDSSDVQANFDQMKIDGKFASGINRIPFDGFRAELHEGERVQSVAEVRRADLMVAEMSNLRGNLNELMLVVAKAVNKTARIESRWDTNGLPPTRT